MPEERQSLPFEPKGSKKDTGKEAVSKTTSITNQVGIPRYVSDRMARRAAVFTGVPTIAGMSVFVGSYFLITKGIADIAPGLTLVMSGGFFLLGLVGLSFGMLSSSWDRQPGSILGIENISTNIRRLRDSIRESKIKK